MANTTTKQNGSPNEEEEVVALWRRVTDAEEKSERRMAEICELLRQMKAAIKKQPNINSVVKNGLPRLEEHIEVLTESRKTCTEALEKCKGMITAKRNKAGSTTTSTPTALAQNATGKRQASCSPTSLLAKDSKKKKESHEDGSFSDWQEVKRKRSKKKKRTSKGKEEVPETKKKEKEQKACGAKKTRKPKSDAILLKPADGKSYADVLSTVRKSVNPESCDVEVKAVRRTRTGEVLVELRKTTALARTTFSEALKGAAGEIGAVRELVPRSQLEIKDLDSCCTQQDVEEAIKAALPGYSGHMRVGVTKPNAREQLAAIVTLEEEAALKLLESAHVRIGWVNCRVRRRAVVPRCYKCLGFDHRSNACKGPDRSKLCFRCGAEDHALAGCTAKPRCFLCAEAEGKPETRAHVAGSGSCAAFRRALAQAKARLA